MWSELGGVDRFSKQTVLIATRKNATTEEVYDLFWIFSVFGIPKRITSDRDKKFKTEKWQNLMKGTEGKSQELQVYFRIYMDYQQTNWIRLCPIDLSSCSRMVKISVTQVPNLDPALAHTYRTSGAGGQIMHPSDRPAGGGEPSPQVFHTSHMLIEMPSMLRFWV